MIQTRILIAEDDVKPHNPSDYVKIAEELNNQVCTLPTSRP